MLDARLLFEQLRELNFEVYVAGEQLRVKTNDAPLTDELKEQIRAYKPALMELVRLERMAIVHTIKVAGKLVTVIDTERKPLDLFEQSMRDRFGDRYQGVFDQ